jgi:PQQ-like domain
MRWPVATAAIAIRCSGTALIVPDTQAEGEASLPPPVDAVRGVPKSTLVLAPLPDQLDPVDPAFGYVTTAGWQVSRVNARTGKPAWSIEIHPPGVTDLADSQPDLQVESHSGYVIVRGSDFHHSYITAVTAAGRLGPVCTLPPYLTTDYDVKLLLHAGVLIMSNPPSEEPGGRSSYVEGYSSATGKRLWSVSSQSSVAGGGASFMFANNTAYVWQESDGHIAAYDARTGHERWTVDPGALDSFSSDNGLIAVLGDRPYALVDRGSVSFSWLVALRTKDGKLAWKRTASPWTGPGFLTVSQVGDGQVLVNEQEIEAGQATGGAAYLLDVGTGGVLAQQR